MKIYILINFLWLFISHLLVAMMNVNSDLSISSFEEPISPNKLPFLKQVYWETTIELKILLWSGTILCIFNALAYWHMLVQERNNRSTVVVSPKVATKQQGTD